MIVAFIVYSLALSLLAAGAAWALEVALARLRRPRRLAWIAGIAFALLMPAAAMLFADAPRAAPQAAGEAIDAPALTTSVAMRSLVATLHDARAEGRDLDGVVLATWIALAAAMLAFHAWTAWRLARRLRDWPRVTVGHLQVSVAPDIGPAAFGWGRPRVIFPKWLLDAPSRVQSLALAHEDQHLAARDPQVLAVAALLTALFPWNAPLLWMLRRLRFAMEVDCDARVLRSGADTGDYGMALIDVSERQSRAPLPAIALIERFSQLERRIDIMLSPPRKWRALAVGACLALAGTCIVMAATVDAPSAPVARATVLKPPPGTETTGFRLGQHFERHLQEKYPELMGGDFDGMPMIVVQLDSDWTVLRSAKTINPDPTGNVSVTNEIFGLIGLKPEEAPYVGAMNMQMAKDKLVVMVYTERVRPGEKFESKVFPDTRKQDRELFEAQFVSATIPAGHNPWVLLDRSGKVLRRGLEVTDGPWHEILERRFAGIDTREVTATPLTMSSGEPMRDAGGREVHLLSVWLAPGSALPAND